MSSTVLLTGTTGFIGVGVLDVLTKLPAAPRIITAGRTKPPIEAREHHLLDLTDPQLRLPKGTDTLLHLAGAKQGSAETLHLINAEGTQKLIEAAITAGVRRFIYLSSVGVYGASHQEGVINESHPQLPKNDYEASKKKGEDLVRGLCAKAGMEYVIIQPSNVIGYVPKRSYPLMGLMSAIKTGRFFFVGQQESWVNYVAVSDVVAAIVTIYQQARSGATYILNTDTTLTNLVGWIAAELGTELPQRHIPAWVGSAAGTIGGSLQSALKRRMPFDRERFRELTTTTRFDGSKIQRELGFKYPLGIETTIRGLVVAYRKEGCL